MKNKLCINLFLVITTVFMSSCGNKFIGANDFARLKKGMDFSKELTVDSDMIPIFEFEFDNQKYQCQVLPVTNYFHKEFTTPQEQKYNGGRSEKTTYFRDFYFLITKNSKLFNWGYLYEFKNDPSNKGSQFGLALEAGYKNYLQKKGIEYVR
ncbi:MAG: hypothetical protein HYZ54_01265 [Ignavibacteriae bacterium]|nr:hypothetical protein [Ignavibacteriota bacterium]